MKFTYPVAGVEPEEASAIAGADGYEIADSQKEVGKSDERTGTVIVPGKSDAEGEVNQGTGKRDEALVPDVFRSFADRKSAEDGHPNRLDCNAIPAGNNDMARFVGQDRNGNCGGCPDALLESEKAHGSGRHDGEEEKDGKPNINEHVGYL